MRLVNIQSLTLHSFTDAATRPKYAILSHRWSADGEITFEEFTGPSKRGATGYAKIATFCQLLGRHARTGFLGVDRVEWCWVDSCCIDKRSSAELSEAVNRMATWYAQAEFCVAYLEDVSSSGGTRSTLCTSAGESSSWFSRGWTLQELLFPAKLLFCDESWDLIPGMNKKSADGGARISAITHIPIDCLQHPRNVTRHCIASRMSWMAERETTIVEDEAYCLLGLFDISMPLVYGEGNRAFYRLQKEIIDQYEDETIFAWLDMDPALVDAQLDYPRPKAMPMLAPHPSWFIYKTRLSTQRESLEIREPYKLTNRGLELEASAMVLAPYREDASVGAMDWDLNDELLVIQLNCSSRFAGMRNGLMQHPEQSQGWFICLRKMATTHETPTYARVLCWATGKVLLQHLRGLAEKDPKVKISQRPRQKYYIAASHEQMSLVSSRRGQPELRSEGDVLTLDVVYRCLQNEHHSPK